METLCHTHICHVCEHIPSEIIVYAANESYRVTILYKFVFQGPDKKTKKSPEHQNYHIFLSWYFWLYPILFHDDNNLSLTGHYGSLNGF